MSVEERADGSGMILHDLNWLGDEDRLSAKCTRAAAARRRGPGKVNQATGFNVLEREGIGEGIALHCIALQI